MTVCRSIAFMFLAAISTVNAATTLQLHPDIELMAVDGQRITSSLLKGADSLALDNGQHQLVFRVVKLITPPEGDNRTYTSPLLLAAFNMRQLDAVTIQLPALDTPQQRAHFTQEANFQLIDNRQVVISARTDKLAATQDDIASRLEPLLAQYNAANHAASVPSFPHARQNEPNWPDNSAPTTADDGIDPFLILKYWFRQADKETQARFLQWAQERGEK